jgi:hypothetical protein
VGDGQRAARQTRACLHAGGEADVGPWSESHLPPTGVADDLAPVGRAEPALHVLHRPPPDGPRERIAAGVARWEPRPAAVTGTPYRGLARRVGLRSVHLAQAGARGRRARLAHAPAAVTARQERRRGRRRGPDPKALREAVDTILTRDRVHGLRHVRDPEHGWERPRRRAGGRDATVRLAGAGPGAASLDQEAKAAAVHQRGWRVSGTPQPIPPTFQLVWKLIS